MKTKIHHGKVRPGWQEERALLAAVKRQDEKALDRFTRDHAATLYRLAYRLCGDEERALSVLTAALTQALDRSGFRREEQELGPWLAGFVLRHAISAPAADAAGGRSRPAPADDEGGRGRRRKGRGRRSARSRSAPTGPTPERAAADGPPPVVDWSPMVEDEATRRDLRARLQLAAGRLPFDLRSAWVLLDAEGRDLDSSAAALELDRGAVLSRLHRARLRLCAALAPPAGRGAGGDAA